MPQVWPEARSAEVGESVGGGFPPPTGGGLGGLPQEIFDIDIDLNASGGVFMTIWIYLIIKAERH